LTFFKKHKEEKFQEHKKLAVEAYYNIKDKSRALKEMEMALELRPDCYETWCQYGDWLDSLASDYLFKDEMNKFDALREKAEQAIRTSIGINPKYALGYYRLANILWGSDFRKSLVEFEKAAALDEQYTKDVERTKHIIAECTHKLGEQKTVLLNSLREKPLPQVFDTEYYFTDTPIGCVVMHTCVSGSQRQWTHSWIFRSENPNLLEEHPIGEVAISSTKDASVSSGCPSNYTSVLEHLYKNNLL